MEFILSEISLSIDDLMIKWESGAHNRDRMPLKCIKLVALTTEKGLSACDLIYTNYVVRKPRHWQTGFTYSWPPYNFQ